jgi:hypothetical protein
LDEERGRKAIAEAFLQSASCADGRYLAMGTLLAALEPGKADGGFVDDG